jgi:prepilin-type N-terminal cleavage/methylation domain-containing protein
MKKGFTLVELVIALALLLVAVTAVNLIFNTASEIWKLNGYKAENSAFNQVVAQRLRAEGKRNVEIILKNIDTSLTPTSAYFYLYFDDADEINTCIDKAIYFSASNNTQGENFKVIASAHSSSVDFISCKDAANNIAGKKYGAFVEIEDSKYGGSTDYKFYQCKVTVWNLKKTDISKVESVCYVGR